MSLKVIKLEKVFTKLDMAFTFNQVQGFSIEVKFL